MKAKEPPSRLERELWRPGEVVARGGAPPAGHQAYGTTTWRGALMVIPLGNRRAAAEAMIRWTDADGVTTIAARGLARVAARIGLSRTLVDAQVLVPVSSTREGSPSLHEYLAKALDVERVELSVAFGSSRPNQKPVVRVHGPSGATVGFAKVGWNDTTKALIEHEAEFLSTLGRRLSGSALVPEVLHRGTWGQRTVVVMSPAMGNLHLRATRPITHLVAAIAALDEEVTTAIGSSYLRDLREHRIPADMEPSARRAAEAAADTIDRRWSGVELRLGRWHGDLTPWNMSRRNGIPIIWDWERTATDAPLGLDLIHHAFHTALAARRRLAGDRFRIAVGEVASAANDLGIDRTQLRAIAALYALEMHLRFRSTSASAGPAWLEGLLPAALADSW